MQGGFVRSGSPIIGGHRRLLKFEKRGKFKIQNLKPKIIFVTVIFVALCVISISIAKAQSVRLLAVGDIMMAEDVGRCMAQNGRGYPFARMRHILRGGDITFGNLECCVSNLGKPIPKKYNFRADPRYAPVLKESGFTIVSLANNHAWDYGRTAMLDTMQNVRQTGVETVGVGKNRADAHKLVIVKSRGLRVGFLAYLGLLPALIAESDTEPTLCMASVKGIKRDVSAALPLVDILIVSLHSGTERAPGPNPEQIAFAQAAIDAGADMVIGHHPHVRQPLVIYKGKPIAYSLGNFVFSTTGRGTGAMVEATLTSNHHVKARLIPLDLGADQPHMLDKPVLKLKSQPFHRNPKL